MGTQRIFTIHGDHGEVGPFAVKLAGEAQAIVTDTATIPHRPSVLTLTPIPAVFGMLTTEFAVRKTVPKVFGLALSVVLLGCLCWG